MVIIERITVVDAPCGAGKTSWAIQMINADPDRAFVYCTPFLTEISRIRDACGRGRIAEPQYRGTTKLEDFNRLLAENSNIATTHETLLNATNETVKNIGNGHYTLILDECLSAIWDFYDSPRVEDSPRQRITADDIQFLRNEHLIEIGGDYRIRWIGGVYGPDSKFYEVMAQANMGRLYLARDRLLITVYPPEVFQAFEQVYVLTYKFEGNLLSAYLKLFELEYETMSVIRSEDGYGLIPYTDDADSVFLQRCRELIKVYGSKRRQKNGALSFAWYEYAKERDLKSVKNSVWEFFFRTLRKQSPKSKDMMWTCPKAYRNKIKGKGYTVVRMPTAAEADLPESEKMKLECFVSCNARATNVFDDRWALAYCCNMYVNPMIKGFLQDKGIEFDNDEYALSMLIQWMFRSRIRKGLPIWIFIPSPRMRGLLERWLDVNVDTPLPQPNPETRITPCLLEVGP